MFKQSIDEKVQTLKG